MSEEQKTPAEGAAAEQAQKFLIQRVYLKDMSFEAPLGANAFTVQIQPSVNQEIGNEARKIADNLFEVVLKLTLTAKTDDKVVFLVEVQQAALFQIEGIDKENLNRLLNTVCPQILFPYAREAADSLLVKGSFPALMIPPVNFEALYAQAVAKNGEAKH